MAFFTFVGALAGSWAMLKIRDRRTDRLVDRWERELSSTLEALRAELKKNRSIVTMISRAYSGHGGAQTPLMTDQWDSRKASYLDLEYDEDRKSWLKHVYAKIHEFNGLLPEPIGGNALLFPLAENIDAHTASPEEARHVDPQIGRLSNRIRNYIAGGPGDNPWAVDREGVELRVWRERM